jgi:hypothetical protein
MMISEPIYSSSPEPEPGTRNQEPGTRNPVFGC